MVLGVGEGGEDMVLGEGEGGADTRRREDRGDLEVGVEGVDVHL